VELAVRTASAELTAVLATAIAGVTTEAKIAAQTALLQVAVTAALSFAATAVEPVVPV